VNYAISAVKDLNSMFPAMFIYYRYKVLPLGSPEPFLEVKELCEDSRDVFCFKVTVNTKER